ncbi:hypothetical protein KGF57_005076 [Candida theae]|uniref:Uncharacterized protein n=1 Tax=Candida theae TaxID=1198502 RepID=A0AAD5FWG6_9ASCO|nr:uncharacterized protein KGF57_005076 [Candida theae]KAI5948883.1 hypothetical protein KGF57_005076 [Candida theae]
MVVRSLIYGVIDRVPVVNNINRFIQERSSVSDVSSTSSSSNSDLESDDATEEEYLQEVVLPQSPKQKIHAKIIKNRATSPSPVPNERGELSVLFDSPTKSKVSAIDKSHIKPVSARLSKRNIEKVDKIEAPDLNTLTSPTLVDDSDSSLTPKQIGFASFGAYESGSTKEARKIHVEQYVNDQNNKFNELISNNLEAVLKEDKTDDEEQENIVFNYNKDSNPGVALLSMMYDNRRVIASSVYKYGKQQVFSRLPYIPLINPKQQVSQDETDQYLIGGKRENQNLSSPFASPILGRALMTLDNSQSAARSDQQDEEISVDLSQQDVVDQRKFDQLMSNLDDEVKIDIFLDSLDEKTKINLLHSLRKDLNMYNQQDAKLSPQAAVHNLYYNENISTIDKIQIFIIISVKLFITGIKLFIPITKYFIHKFQQNQMYIFNAKNMNKFFNFLIKFMNYLDLKLNDNEQLIDQLSKQDYVKTEENIEEMFNEFNERTKSYFKPKYLKEKFIAKDDHVKRSVYDMVVKNFLSEGDEEEGDDDDYEGKVVRHYQEDPNYAMYFTGRSIDSSARESESGSFIEEEDEVDIYEEEEEDNEAYATAASKRTSTFSDTSRRSSFTRRRRRKPHAKC